MSINGFSVAHDPEVQIYKQARREYLRQQQREQQEERERRIDLGLPVAEEKSGFVAKLGKKLRVRESRTSVAERLERERRVQRALKESGMLA